MFYWEVENEVKQLKKEGKIEEALELLLKSIEFGENEAKNDTYRRLYSYPYGEAALLLRKLKRFDDESYILEKFLSNPKATSETNYKKLADRLTKALLLAGKAEKRTVDGIEKIFYLPENVYFEDRSLFVVNGAIVDVETTGLDPNKDEIIELGIVLFSYNHFKGQPLGIIETYSGLREPSISISAEAARVHKIKNIDVQGKSLDDKTIRELFDKALFFIAHNASFDRRFIRKVFPEVGEKNWYCSMNGISWKSFGHKSKGLENLLSDYKIGSNNRHRALDDTKSIYDLLQQTNRLSGNIYLAELLNGFPEPKEDRERRSSGTSTYTINVEVSLPEPKKSFWEILFGK